MTTADASLQREVIGTWNVRTTCETSKLAQVTSEMIRCRLGQTRLDRADGNGLEVGGGTICCTGQKEVEKYYNLQPYVSPGTKRIKLSE